MNTSELLADFFGAYFHQDWDLEASSPDEVVHKFLNNTYNANLASKIISDIHTYLKSAGDNATIEKDLLGKFGCYYTPSGDNIGARQWLLHVVQLLSQNK